MKVKDLIAKLQKADGELEVFASPLTRYPGDVNERIPDAVFVRHPIEQVTSFRNMEPEDGAERVVLGYDDQSPVEQPGDH